MEYVYWSFQEMMTDEPEEFAVEPKTLKKHHGEPRSPSSSKRSSVALPSMKQTRDGESHLGASSVSVKMVRILILNSFLWSYPGESASAFSTPLELISLGSPVLVDAALISQPHFKNNFIYFWLCWVFIAVHRLSLVVVREGYSQVVCGLLLSTGSRCGAQASVPVARGL